VFDCKLFTGYNTIPLYLPTTPGIYYTPYYSFAYVEFPHTLPCIEIVSGTHVRINGGRIQNIHTSSLEDRKLIFDTLYGGRVQDVQHIHIAKDHDIVFFIPSVINVSNNVFDYTSCRSIFSPEERLEQTVSQLQSITDPSSIFLLEGSDLDLYQCYRLTSTSRAHIILFSKDEQGNHYANSHINKSIYELYVMRYMTSLVHATWYFKFGGRYRMIDHVFIIQSFLQSKPVCKIIEDIYTYGNKTIVECILYSFPFSYREKYIDMYTQMMSRAQDTHEGIEALLYELLEDDFERIYNLGVMGKDAIEGFDMIV
jgi:hypothetical protein